MPNNAALLAPDTAAKIEGIILNTSRDIMLITVAHTENENRSFNSFLFQYEKLTFALVSFKTIHNLIHIVIRFQKH